MATIQGLPPLLRFAGVMENLEYGVLVVEEAHGN
jgi:hypothetical protein